MLLTVNIQKKKKNCFSSIYRVVLEIYHKIEFNLLFPLTKIIKLKSVFYILHHGKLY